MLIIKPMLLPAAILAIAVSAWHCVSTLALDEYGPTTTVHSSTKTVKDENDGGSTTGREDTDFWTRFLVDSQGSLLMTPPILTSAPTGSPTDIVSATPSTMLPTPYPSTQPTSMPSQTPTTRFPSVTPTSPPTVVPTTSSPTDIVSMTPTNGPTSSPSSFPTQAPSTMPTTTPSAQPTNLEVVVADFSQANATDPITLYSLPDEEGATNVEVMLPNNQSDVYVITDSSNQGSAGTATCPPTGGIQVPSTGTTVTIPLNGIDTEIVICSGSVIIGRCYHRFQSRVSPTGQPISYNEEFDFTTAEVSSIEYDFTFGPGVERSGPGLIILAGRFGGWSSGDGGFFTLSSLIPPLALGDACPPASNVTLLPEDPSFPFTVFVLEGDDDQIVYACNGGVVGICYFTYVGMPSQSPSGTPTSSAIPTTSGPTMTPTVPFTTMSPTVSTGTSSTVPTIMGNSTANDGTVFPTPAPSQVSSSAPTSSAEPTITNTTSIVCTMNTQCENENVTGVCVQGVCHDEKVDVGSPCDEFSDCKNSVCGRESYPIGDYICCPSNEFSTPGDDIYCTKQPLGSMCPPDANLCDDELICLDGFCVASPTASPTSSVVPTLLPSSPIPPELFGLVDDGNLFKFDNFNQPIANVTHLGLVPDIDYQLPDICYNPIDDMLYMLDAMGNLTKFSPTDPTSTIKVGNVGYVNFVGLACGPDGTLYTYGGPWTAASTTDPETGSDVGRFVSIDYETAMAEILPMPAPSLSATISFSYDSLLDDLWVMENQFNNTGEAYFIDRTTGESIEKRTFRGVSTFDNGGIAFGGSIKPGTDEFYIPIYYEIFGGLPTYQIAFLSNGTATPSRSIDIEGGRSVSSFAWMQT